MTLEWHKNDNRFLAPDDVDDAGRCTPAPGTFGSPLLLVRAPEPEGLLPSGKRDFASLILFSLFDEQDRGLCVFQLFPMVPHWDIGKNTESDICVNISKVSGSFELTKSIFCISGRSFSPWLLWILWTLTSKYSIFQGTRALWVWRCSSVLLSLQVRSGDERGGEKYR